MDQTVIDKAVSGGLFSAAGALCGALVQAWVARKRDVQQREDSRGEASLRYMVDGNKALMDSLLQTVKQLDEQLRLTRAELADCEEKHRESDARIAELEKALNVKTRRSVKSTED